MAGITRALPALYVKNPSAEPMPWKKMADLLADACLWDDRTVRTVRQLADKTERRVKQRMRPGVVHWLRLLHVGWSLVPSRLPLCVLERFRDDPKAEPIMHCTACTTNWPAHPKDRLPECPSYLSSSTVWDNLLQLRLEERDGVGNPLVTVPKNHG
jgi:hypothetical protein